MFDFLKGLGASCRVSGGSKIQTVGQAIEGFGIDMQMKGWLTRFGMVNLTIFLCDRQGNPIVNNAVLQATGKPAFIDGETAIKAVLASPFEYSVKIVANDANNVVSVEAAKKFQADFDAICGIQQPAQPQTEQPQQPEQPQQTAQPQPAPSQPETQEQQSQSQFTEDEDWRNNIGDFDPSSL